MTSISESELELEPIKQGGGRAKKGRANLTIKAETKMWSNLVKGPKEDESETVGLGNGNGEKKANEGVRSEQADRIGRRAWDRTG